MKRYCNLCGCEQEFELLGGNNSKELWGNSHAELWGNSHAVLRENSHAVLRENSHAVLRENSHAVLRENSHAELWGNSHAQCLSPYACGILKSITAECTGRSIGDKPLSNEEYLSLCGIEIKRTQVILYKSVNKDLTSRYTDKIKYSIGKLVVAPDWDSNYTSECGHGLHLSPTVKQAASFHDSGCYLACRVNVDDIADLPAFANYPDKIRVRACRPLYKVDIEGNKLTEVN